MKIGELAKLTNTTRENIRFYELQGLLPAPDRYRNNYRQYRQDHVERLQLIRNCRVSGISLNETRTLLVWADGGGDGKLVEEALEKHLMCTQDRIDQLVQLKANLLALRERVGSTSRPQRGPG